MAKTLTVAFNSTLATTFQDSTDTISTPSDSMSLNLDLSLSNGTGANQADLIFRDTRTLAAGANESLDLYGSLTDPFGATLNFARIKGLVIYNHGGATAADRKLTVGNGATPWLGPFGAAAHTIDVLPGGMVVMWAPDATAWAVTDTSADILKIARASGGSGGTDYKIVIIGASA